MFFAGNLIRQLQCKAPIVVSLWYLATLLLPVASRWINPLLDLSIEELMKVEATTASRHSQKLTQVSSAMLFVITQDDIRRGLQNSLTGCSL